MLDTLWHLISCNIPNNPAMSINIPLQLSKLRLSVVLVNNPLPQLVRGYTSIVYHILYVDWQSFLVKDQIVNILCSVNDVVFVTATLSQKQPYMICKQTDVWLCSDKAL